MGRGFRGFVVRISVLCLSLSCLVGRAETGFLAGLLPALFGVTERHIDDKYAGILNIDPRVTVHLTMPDDGACSGTFLTDTTLLTAAHCVDVDLPGGGINVDGVQSLAFFVHDKFQPNDEEDVTTVDKYDIAIVVFPPGTGRELGLRKYPTLATKPLESAKQKKQKIDIDAYLVGYGIDSLTIVEDEKSGIHLGNSDEMDLGAGVKGWGKCKITKSRGGVLYSTKTDLPISILVPEEADGDEATKITATEKADAQPSSEPVLSAGMPGDSGSSLYNQQGVILGVLSQMHISQGVEVKNGLTEEELEKIEDSLDLVDIFHLVSNVFVDVASRHSHALYRKAILCEKAPCADNFPGSTVEEDAKKYYTEAEYDRESFAHITARTGKYVPHDTNGAIPAYLTPRYAGKTLLSVEIRAFEEQTVSDASSFDCVGNFCKEVGGTGTLEVKAGEMKLSKEHEGKQYSVSYRFAN